MIRAVISGTGSYLPPHVVGNHAIGEPVGKSDTWIYERTGIRQRHLADPGVGASDLAVQAAKNALQAANLPAQSLDLIIVATVTPDRPLPSTAALLQQKIGATCGAVDLVAACAGFIYAMSFARAQIQCGAAQHILVVGAEVISRWIDWADCDTCILFGDGAGAVVLSARPDSNRGVLAVCHGGDGALRDTLIVEAATLADHKQVLRMKGREVYRSAVRHVTQICKEVAAQANWPVDSVDWFVSHQANRRVIEAVARRLNFPIERCVINIEAHGNTSAASIPVALDEAARDGRIQPGQRVILAGLGAGLVWGAIALIW